MLRVLCTSRTLLPFMEVLFTDSFFWMPPKIDEQDCNSSLWNNNLLRNMPLKHSSLLRPGGGVLRTSLLANIISAVAYTYSFNTYVLHIRNLWSGGGLITCALKHGRHQHLLPVDTFTIILLCIASGFILLWWTVQAWLELCRRQRGGRN